MGRSVRRSVGALASALAMCLPHCAHGSVVRWASSEWCVQDGQATANSSTTPRCQWQRLQLPLAYRPPLDRPLQPGARLWVRLNFQIDQTPKLPLGLYVPYLYHGATVRMDGQMVAYLPGSDQERAVRWEGPMLWQVPPSHLQVGPHELTFEMVPAREVRVIRMGPVRVDDWLTLERQRNAREFLVQGLPKLTVLMCAFLALFLSLVWAMRPSEALYGLLAATLLLWGLRTGTFLVESLAHDTWLLWRATYHWATGGVVVMLSLFAAGLAERSTRRWRAAAVLWWWLGPAVLLLGGVRWEAGISLYWTLGLAIIGMYGLSHFARAMGRHRNPGMWAMMFAALLAFAAGVHDLLMANVPQALAFLGTDWQARRLFLLHHAANLMLLCLAGVMTHRFVETLRQLSALNRSLESQVRAREQALALAFQDRADLMVIHAAEEERQRIVLDMHDGLGSRLFTTLTRVERGAASADETSRELRACIDDMRLMIDALAPGVHDLGSAFANFRHRWDHNLQALNIRTRWSVPDEVLTLALDPHGVMHVLKILQEALTNVLKHAQADEVGVAAWRSPEGGVTFEVVDNGRGLSEQPLHEGRGRHNMRRRAERLGGRLSVEGGPQGTRVALHLPQALGAASRTA